MKTAREIRKMLGWPELSEAQQDANLERSLIMIIPGPVNYCDECNNMLDENLGGVYDGETNSVLCTNCARYEENE